MLAGFAKQGKIVETTKLIPDELAEGELLQSWLDMAMKPGPDGKPMMVGVWQRFNGKSLVWYPKKAWDEAGYKIPQTWDELVKPDRPDRQGRRHGVVRRHPVWRGDGLGGHRLDRGDDAAHHLVGEL